MADSQGVFDVPPEVLRATSNAIRNAMEQITALGSQAETVVADVVGSGQFSGDAAKAAAMAGAQIQQDLQKIMQHGTYLAEHLSKSATIVEEGDAQSQSKLQALFAHTSTSV